MKLEIKEHRPIGTISHKDEQLEQRITKFLAVLSPIVFELLDWTKEKTSRGEITIVFGTSSSNSRFQISHSKSTLSLFDCDKEHILPNSVIPLPHNVITEINDLILSRIKPIVREQFLLSHTRSSSDRRNTEMILKFKNASLCAIHTTLFDNTPINYSQYILT
jgi:hypothetical protein